MGDLWLGAPVVAAGVGAVAQTIQKPVMCTGPITLEEELQQCEKIGTLNGWSQEKIEECKDRVRKRHGAPPGLKRIHPDSTYEADLEAKRSLEYWRTRPNDEIIRTLAPGREQALRTHPDGRIIQGNTRTRVLLERGYDINSLPREVKITDWNTGQDTWITVK